MICTEPAIRYAVEKFHGNKISVYCEKPELYQHLKLEKIYTKNEPPNWDKHLVFVSMMDADSLSTEFVCHILINAVDYTTLSMFRCQLPVADRIIRLEPSEKDFEAVSEITCRYVAVHPGSGWQSKTFPKDWWDTIIQGIRENGLVPVIIGSNTVINHGTVDVETFGCVDMRNKLTLMQSVALLRKTNVLITNDSSPLHMAACGNGWIGYVATAKHPDYIEHWRRDSWGTPTFGWRMKNLGHGGMWDKMSFCPNITEPINIERADPSQWLPDPDSVVDWAVEKCKDI